MCIMEVSIFRCQVQFSWPQNLVKSAGSAHATAHAADQQSAAVLSENKGLALHNVTPALLVWKHVESVKDLFHLLLQVVFKKHWNWLLLKSY